MMAASGMTTDDARLVLGRRTTELLEGGRVARLAPERRASLERLAVKLGLRAFDTSLVIAIAQDAARAGETLEEASGRLALVRAPGAAGAASTVVWHLAAAAALASVGVAVLVRWVTG
jgi:hypothetical protein